MATTAAYTGEFAEEVAVDEDAPVMLDADEVKRELRWANDIWPNDGFQLKIYSPFGMTESP
ncbi:hypothetical protein [Puniceicoccus vermicola]|uniref:Uncharacterized protein n=1 Tax=Puniceicoccus vermicola TaxID=388746 RepID=A0A7X1E5L9_9BACT|nr:hypothetical protein [Puniceicoccus vermicola]MBC2601732.1 hypothetical protein [Puniceicoccus vermicola]